MNNIIVMRKNALDFFEMIRFVAMCNHVVPESLSGLRERVFFGICYLASRWCSCGFWYAGMYYSAILDGRVCVIPGHRSRQTRHNNRHGRAGDCLGWLASSLLQLDNG